MHTNHQSVREEVEEKMAEPEGQQGLAKGLRVEAATRRADARKGTTMQQGPEGEGETGKNKGDGEASGSGKGGKRKQSE